MEDRYMVWFYDCPETVFFDDKKEAIHYARLNEGIVKDWETGENIRNYHNPDCNIIIL